MGFLLSDYHNFSLFCKLKDPKEDDDDEGRKIKAVATIEWAGIKKRERERMKVNGAVFIDNMNTRRE